MRGRLVDDRDPLQLIHIILGALQREDRVVKGILSIKALCMVDIPPPNTLHIFFSLISPTSHTMQLPRTTGVQAIFGLVTLFALVPQVSLALAMRKCIKRHNFRFNTEPRGVLLPARASTSTNASTSLNGSLGGNGSQGFPTCDTSPCANIPITETMNITAALGKLINDTQARIGTNRDGRHLLFTPAFSVS